MGYQLLDQYTYLHFATGIIAYFWSLSFWNWIGIHFIFELLENTPLGMNFINKTFTFWPGGKPRTDSLINIVGDNLGAILGWLSALWIDHLGRKKGWYLPHLTNHTP